MAQNGSVTISSVKATPGDFYAKLSERVTSKCVKFDLLPSLTNPDTPPACFVSAFGGDADMALTAYREWLSAATGTEVKYRYDMPGEPNYCHDCTPVMKSAAVRAGTCRFQNTRFEASRAFGEREIIGVSHADMVLPDGYYRFEGMVVPREALPRFVIDILEAEDAKLRGPAP